jgi:hypothetical protein
MCAHQRAIQVYQASLLSNQSSTLKYPGEIVVLYFFHLLYAHCSYTCAISSARANLILERGSWNWPEQNYTSSGCRGIDNFIL